MKTGFVTDLLSRRIRRFLPRRAFAISGLFQRERLRDIYETVDSKTALTKAFSLLVNGLGKTRARISSWGNVPRLGGGW